MDKFGRETIGDILNRNRNSNDFTYVPTIVCTNMIAPNVVPFLQKCPRCGRITDAQKGYRLACRSCGYIEGVDIAKCESCGKTKILGQDNICVDCRLKAMR